MVIQYSRIRHSHNAHVSLFIDIGMELHFTHYHSRRSLTYTDYHNILGFSLNMWYSKTIGPILSKFTAFTTDI